MKFCDEMKQIYLGTDASGVDLGAGLQEKVLAVLRYLTTVP